MVCLVSSKMSLSTMDVRKLTYHILRVRRSSIRIMLVSTPINLLPPETLSKIFLACTLCWTAYDRRGGRDELDEFIPHSHLPWIEITRVCRYWRSVALACPELWGALIFSRREATMKMIHLSKGAALIVKAGDIHQPNIDLYANVRMAIAELQRVSVLHLQFHTDILQRLVDGLLAAAPKLQSLRLRGTEGQMAPVTLPETIFNQCAPSLRLLELSHCKFVWQSLPLRGLTHLELRNPAIPPSIVQILSFLQETPILNTIILDQALSTDSKHAETSSLRLFLPNLYRLSLDDSVDHCADLLEHLIYSAQTLVSFHCELPSADRLGRVFEAIQSAAAYGDGDHVICSLGLSLEESDFLEPPVLIFRCGVTLRHFTPHFTPLEHFGQPAQLTFTMSDPLGGWLFPVPALRAAGAAICLTDVQTFYVGTVQLEVDWLFFLHRLPNVHTIHFEYGIPTGFLQVLSDNGMEETKSNASTTPLLPSLRTLWLTGVRFGRGPDALLTFFQCRRQFDVAIEHVHLRDCWEFSGDDVIKLKEFVQDVDWDDCEQYDEPYQYNSADAGFYYD
jgi:hypothetical protein